MTVFAVTFDGTRLNQVQDYTNWSNYGGAGAGGAVEPSLAYQNGQCAARKQATTGGTLGGIQLAHAATVDMTATDRDLWFFKYYLADAFDANVTEGARIGIGDGSSASSKSYNIAGSTATNDAHLAYPAAGGYILSSIDPANTFWPIAIAGTADLTLIDWFGCQGSWINGNAKSLNIAMDAIDIGAGLYLVGGTSTDPDATFVSYVVIDQDITTNRWGVCGGAGANVNAWGILRAGGAIEFNDTTSIVSFKDGYHGAGFTGVLHELDTAASTFTVGATIIGEGKLYNAGAIDTRPDYVVTGTTMTALYNFSANLRNHRNITFNTKVDCDGGDIECQLLTQATAEIQNSTIRTNALTSIACLQDPTFGTTSDLHDTDFVQTGVGHAIELVTVGGTFTFTNLTFTGYGADTTDDAALDITAATGTTTINYTGAAPTYKTAGATVVLVGNPITTTVTVNDNNAAPLLGARVILETSSAAGDLPFEETPTSITRSGTTATANHTAHGIPDGKKVVIRGATDTLYNGVFVTTFVSANSYTYVMNGTPAASPATGTITASGVMLEGTTDSSGIISDSRTISLSQPVKGRISSGTASPYFKDSPLSGIVSNTLGLGLSAQLILDE